ncbi:hypothetical protein K491DRAFT_606198 [Lophiostoma macrostomum CBS 122681]|uniref:Rhodopsin domain-containing protein n=1 Tax=Lophiostoma macrostomum CBS 122681 TaxID=1314788 RepID=A0A6A6SW36_9PLEO|nr:hypothetical protein K491DRAFT_606198 [Lophiostoma macrostomum CBS 122681]
MANDEDAGPTILAVTLTITIVALFTFITRLYVRIKMIRNVGWDDYLMAIAMCLVCNTGQAVIIPEVSFGAGRHKGTIPDKDFQTAFMLNVVTQPLYVFAICFVKVSIGFFLLRVAVTPFYRRTIISIMVLVGAYTFAGFITIVAQCTNLAVQWDPTVEGTCWGPNVLKGLSYANQSFNILTDLLFAVIIPIPMLWNLQMNTRQKSTVIGILGLGVFGTAAALVKMSYLTNYGKRGDYLWDSSNITIWTVLESNIGIICGNLPCMKPLFRRVLGSTYGRGTRKTTSAPKYFSRPHGAGTGHHTEKNYSTLASGRTQHGLSNPNGTKDAYMMTTFAIDNPKDDASQRSIIDETPGKTSSESVQWLKENSLGKYGGIMKTTEVSVSGSSERAEGYEDGISVERQAIDMV